MTERNIAPPLRPIEKIYIPKPQKCVLKNRMSIYLIQHGHEDVVQIEFVFRAAFSAENKTGVSLVANELIVSGTKSKTSKQIAEALEFYGASVEHSSGADIADVSLLTLTKNLPKTFPILEDVLLNAVYPEDELVLFCKRAVARLQVNKKRTDYRAREEFVRALFPKHPYGTALEEEDYKNISRDDLDAFRKQFYVSGNGFILVSGKFNEKEILDLLNGMDLPSAKEDLVFRNENVLSVKGEIKIPMKDALQSSLRMGLRAIPRTHGDYPKLQVLNTILGGYFGSRLMANLREEKGYTYGVGSSAVGLSGDGYLAVGADVAKEVTFDAVKEIKSEMEKLCTEKVSGEELSLVRQYLLGQFTGDMETPFQIASNYKTFIMEGIHENYFEKYLEIVKNISADELRSLAEKYFRVNDLTTVICGDV